MRLQVPVLLKRSCSQPAGTWGLQNTFRVWYSGRSEPQELPGELGHLGRLLSPSHCSARLCHLPSHRSVLCQVPGWPGHLLHCPKELTCLSFVNNKDANKACSWSTIPGAFWKRKGRNLLTARSVVLTTACQYCSLHFVLGGVMRVSQVEGKVRQPHIFSCTLPHHGS